ncbi:TetR/AcrR family transcriptional regulator [Kitasatospora sp. NPDC059646]|uniref:TetR/AcrR family transcriptional regulator n=1 Tax=Kitasatospora sp. NPDC059646 TaxID=3346893 RepID=UPI0036A8CDF6
MTADRAPRSDAQRNRRAVLAAAEEVFAAGGPGASLNEVARRAGVGPGTLYRHFPGRGPLLAALVADRIDRLTERGRDLLAAPSAGDGLAEWLAAFVDHARANQGLGGAALLEAAGHEAGLDCADRIRAAAEALTARAHRADAVRPAVRADDLLDLALGIALATAADPAPDRAHRLLALALAGVRTPA